MFGFTQFATAALGGLRDTGIQGGLRKETGPGLGSCHDKNMTMEGKMGYELKGSPIRHKSRVSDGQFASVRCRIGTSVELKQTMPRVETLKHRPTARNPMPYGFKS